MEECECLSSEFEAEDLLLFFDEPDDELAADLFELSEFDPESLSDPESDPEFSDDSGSEELFDPFLLLIITTILGNPSYF